MRTNIQLDPVELAALSPMPGWRALSTDIGTDGEVIRMFAPKDAADLVLATNRDIDGFPVPATRSEVAFTATVVIEDAIGRKERKLPLQQEIHPVVQLLPNDEILVVAPTFQGHLNDPHYLNARVFDSNGLVQEFYIGDDLRHIQTDPRGRIWVGHGDQWGGDIECYDRSGCRIWTYDPPGELPGSVHCYAMNVARDYAWVCYHRRFPIVRIDDQWNINAWAIMPKFLDAIAVSGASVLAFGGYGVEATRCVLLSLGNGRSRVVADVALRLPDSIDLRQARVVGRGERLYVITDDRVFAFTVPA